MTQSHYDRLTETYPAARPAPESIEKTMRNTGLDVTVAAGRFLVTIDRNHWFSLVAGRAMSALPTVTDAELDAGSAPVSRSPR